MSPSWIGPGPDLQEHVKGLTSSNGLCWSPDGCAMYHADSLTHTIHAFPFDASRGVAGTPSTFAQADAHAFPDGSATDTAGGIWSAQWGAAQVVHYHNDVQPDFVVDLPVSQPTCVAFGGGNLNLLFVTSARDGLSMERLSEEPDASPLFILQTGFTELPASELRQN
jgi:L-arabinonolactonase